MQYLSLEAKEVLISRLSNQEDTTRNPHLWGNILEQWIGLEKLIWSLLGYEKIVQFLLYSVFSYTQLFLQEGSTIRQLGAALVLYILLTSDKQIEETFHAYNKIIEALVGHSDSMDMVQLGKYIISLFFTVCVCSVYAHKSLLFQFLFMLNYRCGVGWGIKVEGNLFRHILFLSITLN